MGRRGGQISRDIDGREPGLAPPLTGVTLAPPSNVNFGSAGSLREREAPAPGDPDPLDRDPPLPQPPDPGQPSTVRDVLALVARGREASHEDPRPEGGRLLVPPPPQIVELGPALSRDTHRPSLNPLVAAAAAAAAVTPSAAQPGAGGIGRFNVPPGYRVMRIEELSDSSSAPRNDAPGAEDSDGLFADGSAIDRVSSEPVVSRVQRHRGAGGQPRAASPASLSPEVLFMSASSQQHGHEPRPAPAAYYTGLCRDAAPAPGQAPRLSYAGFPDPGGTVPEGSFVVTEDQMARFTEAIRRQVLAEKPRMGPPVREPMAAPVAQSPAMSIVEAPMAHSHGNHSTAGHISPKDIPSFSPVVGIIPFMKLRHSWIAFYSVNKRKLGNDTGLQVSLLTGRFNSDAAWQFLRANAAALVRLCPEAEEHLQSLGHGNTMSSIAMMHARENDPDSARYSGAAGREDSGADGSMLSRVRDAMRVRGHGPLLSRRDQGAEERSPLLANALHSFGGGSKTVVQTKTFPFIIAFLMVAEQQLCRPVQGELKMWDSMKLGQKNDLDESVDSKETPEQFMARLVAVYSLFNEFCPHVFEAQSRKNVYDTFMDGLPSIITQRVKGQMELVPTIGMLLEERLGMAAQLANSVHESYILKRETDGARDRTERHSAQGPGDADRYGGRGSIKQTLINVGVSAEDAGILTGKILRGDKLDRLDGFGRQHRGNGGRFVANVATQEAVPRGGDPPSAARSAAGYTGYTGPGAARAGGNNPGGGSGFKPQGGRGSGPGQRSSQDATPRERPPCALCQQTGHFVLHCPMLPKAQEALKGAKPGQQAPPGMRQPSAPPFANRAPPRPVGATSHVHFTGQDHRSQEEMEHEQWEHSGAFSHLSLVSLGCSPMLETPPGALQSCSAWSVAAGFDGCAADAFDTSAMAGTPAGATSCTMAGAAPSSLSAFVDQKRMPVSFAEMGPGLHGRSRARQRLAAIGAAKEQEPEIHPSESGSPAEVLAASKGPLAAEPAAPSPLDRPLSYDVAPVTDGAAPKPAAYGKAPTASKAEQQPDRAIRALGNPPTASKLLSVALAAAADLGASRTIGEYLRRLPGFQRLRYLRQPKNDPSRCLGLSLHGEMHTDLLTLCDDGSNIHLLTLATCRRKGIPVHPTSIRLTTSNASDTGVAGITDPISMTYGVGGAGGASLTVHHCMLVVDGMDHVFEMLLGNIDTQRFDGIINSRSSEYTLHPHARGSVDGETSVSLPTMYAAPRSARSVHGAQ